MSLGRLSRKGRQKNVYVFSFLGFFEVSTLKTLTVLPLAITALGGTEGYFSLAIIACGAFGFTVPKYYYRLGKMDKWSLDSLI